MLMFPANARVFYCPAPDSLGLSCDGPAGAVCSLMKRDPLEEGGLFAFFNRRGMVKILQWEEDGFRIWGKRLERGQFNAPLSADGRHPGGSPAGGNSLIHGKILKVFSAHQLPRGHPTFQDMGIHHCLDIIRKLMEMHYPIFIFILDEVTL